MEGTTNPESLEHLVLVGSLDSGLMEGMSSLDSLEQSVLNMVLLHTTYGRNHGNGPAGAFSSGDALGLWTIEFGITGEADV